MAKRTSLLRIHSRRIRTGDESAGVLRELARRHSIPNLGEILDLMVFDTDAVPQVDKLLTEQKLKYPRKVKKV